MLRLVSLPHLSNLSILALFLYQNEFNENEMTVAAFSSCQSQCYWSDDFSLYCNYWHCRRCYIRFIRKVNEKKGLEGQEETRKAFDFMLSYVGVFSIPNYITKYPKCLILMIYYPSNTVIVAIHHLISSGIWVLHALYLCLEPQYNLI